MKKAFTLVELMVVVGIIAVLATVLMASLFGGTESARNAKCLTNMRNLAVACQTYGMRHGHYPLAGSVERMGIDISQGVSNVRQAYSELTGWLSWNSQNAYRSRPSSHVASAGWFTSCYNQDDVTREYALTNGCIWSSVSANRETFICPQHRRKFQNTSTPPLWSYVMNSHFGWDNSKGARAKSEHWYGVKYGELKSADRRLLFAEIPFMGVEVEAKVNTGSGTDCDCTLQYKDSDGGEVIGFNHSSGKSQKFAHVVFADAHVEQLNWPKNGYSHQQLRDLTEWLCNGEDVLFNNGNVQKAE
jgi:prepilin-type N-terminal cleavage/methylation domain-containing protein